MNASVKVIAKAIGLDSSLIINLHAWSSSSSGSSSSITSTASSTAGSTGPVDVLITPSGVGVIVFPLAIVLSLGPPKPCLCQRCDA